MYMISLRRERKAKEIDVALMKKMLLEKVSNNVERLKDGFIDEVDEKLKKLVEEYINELINATSINDIHKLEVKNKGQPKGQHKDKEFIPQNSLLTELFEIEHIKTIRHIFIAALVLLFLNTVICNFADTGKLNIGIELISWAFGKFHVVIAVWMLMFFSVLTFVYPGFNFWIAHRRADSIGIHDYIWFALYIFYICAFFYLPVKQIVVYELPPASSSVILCEQIRFLMKGYAFIRTNAPKVLQHSDAEDSKTESKHYPDFSKFLYFLFAPTLVYRDSYPRSSTIRWYYVATNIAQFIGCVFYVNFMIVKFITPGFEKFGQEPMTPKNLVLCVFRMMLPSTFIFACICFGIIHSWLNAFAELLRFADRKFYLDWWNSRTFSGFYRTWNIVLHDWLYTYIYKDIFKFSSNKVICLYIVFTLSAVVHEFIVIFTLRIFYPILYIFFAVFSVGLVLITEKGKARKWNVFVWLMLFIGNGVVAFMYTMEWYARINCPPYDNTFLDYIIPRSWVCYPLAVSSNGIPQNVKDEL